MSGGHLNRPPAGPSLNELFFLSGKSFKLIGRASPIKSFERCLGAKLFDLVTTTAVKANQATTAAAAAGAEVPLSAAAAFAFVSVSYNPGVQSAEAIVMKDRPDD